MPSYKCEWDLEDDPDGNIQHIAEHGLTIDDVEHALVNGDAPQSSRSSNRRIVFGPTCDGRDIAVIFEQIDDGWIYVVTAYEPTEE